MNDSLEHTLKHLPDKPGIYQFLNEKGKVIYVGKARNLRNRVRSYFHNGNISAKTNALVSRIADVQLIVTDNEIEALVLENNLIKELKPRYNINLRDDKSYPYIKITYEPFPRIYPTRRLIKDGSRYFGPYTSVHTMKSALRMINQIFRIRSCKLNLTPEAIANKKFKICLDYHIKKCDGPCEGLVTSNEYGEMVNEVSKVLKGKTDDLIAELNSRMNDLVNNLEFEKAAELRDKIAQLKQISEKQKIVSDDFEDRDIIACAFEGKECTSSILNIRNGKLVAKKQLRLNIENDEDPAEIYSALLKFYYSEFVEIPKEIVVETEPTDCQVINEWLNIKSGKKIKLFVPQRGNLRSLVKMCKENAVLQLKELHIQKMKNQGGVPYSVSALQKDLHLKELPKKIECFDISNLQGTDTVASMVVFEDGKPKKSQYRKFIIKDVTGPDDFTSMREVIRRRYSKIKEEGGVLPELIMVDGGKGQLSSAVEIMDELGFSNYNIIGLAKRLEEVYFPGKSEPETISKTSSGLRLLQQVRDEAHRFAITFHRNRRSKRTITSELLNIKGIGTSTTNLLLKEIGSIQSISEASFERLTEVVGKKKAEIIQNHFRKEKTEDLGEEMNINSNNTIDKMRTYKVFTVSADPFNEEILSGVLWELDITGINEVDNVLYVFADGENISSNDLKGQLSKLMDEKLIKEFNIDEKTYDYQNWNEEWEKKTNVIKVSDSIVIKPTFREFTPENNETVIIIDPKMSFGTGEHQTTKLSLINLKKYTNPGMKVLDVGTGTGVLAIASIKFGAAYALGIDIDEWAEPNFAENAKLNHVENQVEVRTCGIEAVPEKEFDLIAANIQKNVLLSICNEMGEKTIKDGVIILSGLLIPDEDDIVKVYTQAGFELIDKDSLDEWIVLVFRKK